MVGNDGEHAAGRELVAKQRQRRLQRVKLPVHRDAKRLKQSREITGSGPRAVGAANRVDEVIAYAHRFSRAPAHDLPGESAGTWLVSKVVKDAGKVGFIEAVEQIGGGIRTSTVHPHVE